MNRNTSKARGWIVVSEGMLTGLSKPGFAAVMPSGVKKVLFFSGRATVFPDRRSAQRAIDNRKKFDILNGNEPFPAMRISVLYEP